MRTIKFRGINMNGDYEFGYLTRKKLRRSGEIVWAIAKDDCRESSTVPVRENSIAQLVGVDDNGREVYEGDRVISAAGYEYTAGLHVYPMLNDYRLKGTSNESA